MNYWLAVGPVTNWKIALERELWGVPIAYRKHWELVGDGDIILFYVTVPVAGVVGYGAIRSKRVEGTLVWPEEIELNFALWPLRLEFKTSACLGLQYWEAKRISLKKIGPKGALVARRAFQRIEDDSAERLVSALDSLIE